MMKRYLAHRVIVDDIDYGMSIITINDDYSMSVEPYEAEIHSTRFINGVLTVITLTPGQPPLLFANGKPLPLD
ncbi:MAG: hypothetical protein J6C44_00635 [Muribaculaceae bacterium]|nr:hypothetical protein [Muribaculaceae bacterium]